MDRWLPLGACILPTPTDVVIPLSQWERISIQLVVNTEAKAVFRWVR